MSGTQREREREGEREVGEFSGAKVTKMGHEQKNDKTERERGLGRKTREETGKGNQMTALIFQRGGNIRHPRDLGD